MADEVVPADGGNMRKKILNLVNVDYTSLIAQLLRKHNLGDLTNNGFSAYNDVQKHKNPITPTLMIPIVDSVYSSGENGYSGADATVLITGSGTKSFKVTRPGYIYRSHVKGSWDKSNGYAVYVAKTSSFNPAYEYVQFNDNTGSKNSLGGCMVPIRPGSDGIYIQISSNLSGDEQLLFLPAYSTSMNSGISSISSTSRVVSGNLISNDSVFRELFS